MVEQSRHREQAVVLLTRPKAQSERFAKSLAGRFEGVRVLVSPILETRFLVPDLPDARPAGLIFTSETGVEGYGRLTTDRSAHAWCVGGRTACAAIAAGFDASSAEGDAPALIRMILGSGTDGPLLHARGRDVTGSIATALSDRGLSVTEAVVYEQAACQPTQAALHLLRQNRPVLLPLFSPRSARLAAAFLAERTARLSVSALSAAVAQEAAVLFPERVIVARSADEAGMMEAIAQLFSGA